MSWLDEIRERAEKATKGPWFVEKFYHEEQEYQEYIKSAAVVHDNGTSLRVITRNDWSNPVVTDLEFIAHAREDVPRLLAYIDKLHEALVLFETDECLNGGSFQCIYEAGNSNICGECIRKWAEEAVK